MVCPQILKSLVKGLAEGARQTVARSGVLGDAAQDEAIAKNGDLGEAVALALSPENRELTGNLAQAYVEKYPIQVLTRCLLGSVCGSLPATAITRSPAAGAVVTGVGAVAIYGNAIHGVQVGNDIMRSVLIGD